MQLGRREFIGLSLLTFLVACGANTSNSKSPQGVTLTVSAAASLQKAMDEIGKKYQEKQPNIEINYHFDASGALQQQIEQGAPVDIFISAAPKQMNALETKGFLLTGTRQDFLKNQVVLIAPKEAINISDFKDLSDNQVKKIVIGKPESVPVGEYSKEVLTSLKLYDKLQDKLVFAKDVRQVLSYVETGNVDAGIVYQTDAKLSDKIKVIAIAPETSHSPIIYPIAVLKDSKSTEAAKMFVQFLFSDEAKVVFKNYGFTMVNDSGN